MFLALNLLPLRYKHDEAKSQTADQIIIQGGNMANVEIDYIPSITTVNVRKVTK